MLLFLFFRLPEAEMALIGSPLKYKSVQNFISDVVTEYGEADACHVLSLLGDIFLQTERAEWAEKCFSKCLQLNPFMWTAFEKLCKNG